jgi:hypothetical protein
MHHDASRDAPPTSFIKPHAKDKHGSEEGERERNKVYEYI